jgi:hypothetical protein
LFRSRGAQKIAVTTVVGWFEGCSLYIDYISKYGRFLVSLSCATISNPTDSVSSLDARVDPGMSNRNWKKCLSE